jgi:hypothetical protein
VVADVQQSSSGPPRRKTGRPTPAPAIVAAAPLAEAEEDVEQLQWLFKLNDDVLGPVPAIVIFEKLSSRELGEDAEVAKDGGSFAKLVSFPAFARAAAKATRAAAEEAAERAHAASVRNNRMAKWLAMAMCFAAPAAGSAVAARALMAAKPWDDGPAWQVRVPAVVDLPPPEAKPTPPDTRMASTDPPANTNADPKVDDKPSDDGDRNDNDRRRNNRKDRDDKGSKSDKPDAKAADKTDKPEDKPPPNETPGIIQESLSNEQAVAPLKGVSGDFKACFKAEMAANPAMPEKVTLSYTVTEDGKAINVELDPKDLRGRPVVDCVRKAMSSLRWPKFRGERKNVSIPFKLGKPKPAGT